MNAALVAVDAVRGVARDFLWSKLREGAIKLRGSSPGMAAVVVLGSALLLLTATSFALGDVLRTGRDLIVLPSGAPGRGSLVPSGLVPATLVLLSAGAALALGGALHAPRAVRVAMLLLWLAVSTATIGLARALEDTADSPAWPAWVPLLGVVAVFVVRGRRPPAPVIELGVLFASVGSFFAITGTVLVQSDELSGGTFAIQQLSVLLGQLLLLSTPLLFVAGLDVIAFGVDASTWVLRFVDRRLPAWSAFLGVAALGGWRSRDLLVEQIGAVRDSGAADALLPVLGAGLLVAALWGWWLVVSRLAGRRPGSAAGDDTIDHGSARVRLPLGAAFAGTSILLVPLLLVVQSLSYFDVTSFRTIELLNDVVEGMGSDVFILWYRLVLGTGLVVVAGFVARRGDATLAMFLGAVGLAEVIARSLAELPGVGDLLWDGPEELDVAWTITFVATGLWWAARRRLTEVRAERLLHVLLLGALLRQFGFISDPLAPLLGFAGVGFVVFGLVWGYLTGGGWANGTSDGYPRSTRVFLYVGYSLFSVSLLNWFAVTHSVGELASISDNGAFGVRTLGYPLLYALFTLGLSGAGADRPIDEDDDVEPVDVAADASGVPASVEADA